MKKTRVEIDLNSLRPDGTTRVRMRNVHGQVEKGQIVTAYESEDGVAAIAMVDKVDASRDVIFVTVNRDSMRDDDGFLDAPAVFSGTNRAVAAVRNKQAAVAVRGRKTASMVHASREAWYA